MKASFFNRHRILLQADRQYRIHLLTCMPMVSLRTFWTPIWDPVSGPGYLAFWTPIWDPVSDPVSGPGYLAPGIWASWVRYLAPAPGPQHLYGEIFVTKFSESIAFDLGSKNSDIAVSNASCLFIHSENFRGSNTSKLLRTFISSSL